MSVKFNLINPHYGKISLEFVNKISNRSMGHIYIDDEIVYLNDSYLCGNNDIFTFEEFLAIASKIQQIKKLKTNIRKIQHKIVYKYNK